MKFRLVWAPFYVPTLSLRSYGRYLNVSSTSSRSRLPLTPERVDRLEGWVIAAPIRELLEAIREADIRSSGRGTADGFFEVDLELLERLKMTHVRRHVVMGGERGLHDAQFESAPGICCWACRNELPHETLCVSKHGRTQGHKAHRSQRALSPWCWASDPPA